MQSETHPVVIACVLGPPEFTFVHLWEFGTLGDIANMKSGVYVNLTLRCGDVCATVFSDARFAQTGT